MRISIITVAFNAACTIANTLESVAVQKHIDIEHIVVDGASTDGTIEVIKCFGKHVAKLISEPDEGLYDAMNKGLDWATGDVVGFLNADDFYANDTVLSKVAESFSNNTIDACYSDLVYVDQQDTDKVVRYWKSCNYRAGLFEHGWVPPHPTFFVRRSVYKRLGGFNLDFRLAADFELMIRFLAVHQICSIHIPRILVKMRIGGKTNQSITNIILQNKEILEILKQYGLHVSLIRFLGNKFWSRGKQFLVRQSVSDNVR